MDDLTTQVLDKAMKMEEDRLKAAILAKLKYLMAEGKDLLAGTFTAQNGAVTLDVTNYGPAQYHVCYCCQGKMWNWIIDKIEFELK